MSYFRGKWYVYATGDETAEDMILHGDHAHCCDDGFDSTHHAVAMPLEAIDALALARVAEMTPQEREKAVAFAEQHGRGNVGFVAFFAGREPLALSPSETGEEK